MNTTTARQTLTAKIESQTTTQLLSHHAALDAMTEKAAEHRLVSALIADEITKRLDLDAALDAVFADEEFAGSYHEALLIAIVTTGVTV